MRSFLRRTLLLWVAGALLVAGYLLLMSGDITVAPLLLVVGYCVLLPIFLWLSFRNASGE